MRSENEGARLSSHGIGAVASGQICSISFWLSGRSWMEGSRGEGRGCMVGSLAFVLFFSLSSESLCLQDRGDQIRGEVWMERIK